MATAFCALLAVVSIAFPQEAQRLPAVSHCYVIGATDATGGVVVVEGRRVPVYRTGAWATLVDVTPGSNEISVVSEQDSSSARVSFFVAAPPKPRSPSSKSVPPKKYEKLPYAGDTAKDPPTNRAPSEITIVLDPGHGGTDSGALSPHRGAEKLANLLLTKSVRRNLVEAGYRVVLTREGDTAYDLYKRPKVAHAEHADAFVSIHHNAPPCDRDPNRLRYRAVYCWNSIGEALAKAINRRIARIDAAKVGNNGVMRANYAVTRNPEIPSCLVEADFVTHPEGEEAIWSEPCREALARAIADGIADWCRGEATP